MQDENHGYDVKVLDVSDLSNIQVLSTFNSEVDTNSIAHNVIIKDNLIYIPYYHDGLRVFDMTDPHDFRLGDIFSALSIIFFNCSSSTQGHILVM